MSPTQSLLRAVVALVVVGACQSADKKPEKRAAPDHRVTEAPVDPKAAARQRCKAAADGFVAQKTLGTQLIAACAPLLSKPGCRRALEAAAAGPSAAAGMKAIAACKLAYCPEYSLAELCEDKSPPTINGARAMFPRLVAEVLQAEHGKQALGTLDAVAYLMIKPLLPQARAVYIRARKGKGGAVELGIGEDGWTACKTTREVTVARGADLREVGGPLLGPMAEVAADVDPNLVEVLVDPDDDPRVLEVATAAGRFLARRGMEMVMCRNKRRNCPDVAKCP